jgi:hypothetical protein
MQSKSEYICNEREEFGGELDAEMLQDARDTAQAQIAYNEAGLNGRAINWRYWVHQMPALKAMQVACLMSALEPDIFANLNERPGKIDPAKCIEKARKIQRLAEAHGWLTASPAEWVEWAMKHGIIVHDGFRLAVSELLADHGAPEREDADHETATAGAQEKGETAKPRPFMPGKPSSEIIECFKLEPAEAWREKLRHIDKAAKAYKDAIAQRGSRGKGSHTWQPARFAICLLAQKEKDESQLRVALTKHFPDSLSEFVDLKIEMGS